MQNAGTVTIPKALLDPFLRFVQVNDSDTLSRLRKDSEQIAIASGSWTGEAPLTLGDLRALARAAQEGAAVEAT